MNIQVNQIRAARGLLGWSQKILAQRSGISDVSIINYENGKRTPHQNTLDKIMRAFEIAGVEFTEDGGIRPRQSRIVTLEGSEGFKQFFDDVYEIARSHPEPDLCSTNQQERLYDFWLGDYEPFHVERMNKIGARVRTILKKGDDYMTSSGYTDYRWIGSDIFSETSLYMYGDKMAIIDFREDNVFVTIIDNESTTSCMRKMFEVIWKSASETY